MCCRLHSSEFYAFKLTNEQSDIVPVITNLGMQSRIVVK